MSKIFEGGKFREMASAEKPQQAEKPIDESFEKVKGFKIEKNPDGSLKEVREIPLSEALKFKPKEERKDDLEMWEKAIAEAKEKKAA